MVTFSDEVSANSSLYVERFRNLKILSAAVLYLFAEALLYEKESPVVAERFNSIAGYVL